MTAETTYTVHDFEAPGDDVTTRDAEIAEYWSREGRRVTARTEGQR